MQEASQVGAALRRPFYRAWEVVMGDVQAEFKSNGDVTARVPKALAVWVFRFVLLGTVGWVGTERISLPKLLPSAKDVAIQIVTTPEFKSILRQELVEALRQIEAEDQIPPPPKKQTTRRRQRSPQGTLQDGDVITTTIPDLPIFGFNRIPLPPMEQPK